MATKAQAGGVRGLHGWPREGSREASAKLAVGARSLGARVIVVSVRSLPRKPEPPVSSPPSIRLGFGNEKEHGVGWTARCNSFGGNARITATKIEVDQVASTTVGCSGEREEEDDWLFRFMDSDPEWRMDGTELTLIANGTKIELMGFRDPKSCPISPSGGRIDFGANVGCETALNLLTIYAEGRSATSTVGSVAGKRRRTD